MELTINGRPQSLWSDELLIEVINRGEAKIPQFRYPQDVLQGVAVAVSETLGCYERRTIEPPGLFSLLSRFRCKESRRSLLSSLSSCRFSGIKSSCVEVATKHGSTARRSPWR
jgi:hypothetical protein